jgi:hypothetical protein
VTTLATSISDWLADRVHALTDWAGPSWNAAAEWLQRHTAGPLAWARPHSREIAIATAAAIIAVIGIWALRSLRRGRQLERSLAEATLDRDAKTHWFTLEIVMHNFQRHPLLVRSVEIIDPPGTKICDRWQAWRPETASVKFVAPELDLTGSASIETTIFPYNSNDYARQTDELIRQFYVQPPDAKAKPSLALRARLVCELQTRRGRRQELTFRRTLTPAKAEDQSAIVSS